ncbi:hypothetical protein POM88_008757 [Heracleum sosnowskyi]|uniref:Uncharacterized protein n=1 Tax=Heracleum sosnowskyi TaxID=360622 RepID=A0AAD8J8K8_9APIA|nr:hypothetical protein POM88_008757 [Heracleum sosnowskyi]
MAKVYYANVGIGREFRGLTLGTQIEIQPRVDIWMFDNVSGKLNWTKKFNIEYGLDDLDIEIWLSCYLGAKQFYGKKLLNGDYFVYEILYDYEKKETKYYGLREEIQQSMKDDN